MDLCTYAYIYIYVYIYYIICALCPETGGGGGGRASWGERERKGSKRRGERQDALAKNLLSTHGKVMNDRGWSGDVFPCYLLGRPAPFSAEHPKP